MPPAGRFDSKRIFAGLLKVDIEQFFCFGFQLGLGGSSLYLAAFEIAYFISIAFRKFDFPFRFEQVLFHGNIFFLF